MALYAPCAGEARTPILTDYECCVLECVDSMCTAQCLDNGLFLYGFAHGLDNSLLCTAM